MKQIVKGSHKEFLMLYSQQIVVHSRRTNYMVKPMPQRIESDRVLLSTDEAGELDSVSPAYIQRLLRDGRIEGIKFGTVWRVYEDSLKTFFAQPRKRGPKGPHHKEQLVTCPDTIHAEHVERDLSHEPDQEVSKTQSASQPGAKESRVVTE